MKMINNVSLVGRLTKDVEIRKTESNKSVASITLAIGDRFNKDHTDFINCVVWNSSAEYLNKYATKGDVIGLTGRIATRTYDGRNGKVYVTEVVADNVSIIGSRKNNQSQNDNVPEPVVAPEVDNGNMDIDPDELPFF